MRTAFTMCCMLPGLSGYMQCNGLQNLYCNWVHHFFESNSQNKSTSRKSSAHDRTLRNMKLKLETVLSIHWSCHYRPSHCQSAVLLLCHTFMTSFSFKTFFKPTPPLEENWVKFYAMPKKRVRGILLFISSLAFFTSAHNLLFHGAGKIVPQT